MNAARNPDPRESRLLILTPEGNRVTPFTSIADEARPGDVWVVNDAATFPASLSGKTADGAHVELRLFPHPPALGVAWTAVAFGAGDWRTKTEDRPSPPRLKIGDAIFFAEDFTAVVVGISAESRRLVEIRFGRTDDEVWKKIYRYGKPVQYAYLDRALALWSVQTPFAARPWASEMPSAGRPLEWRILCTLRDRGAEIHFLTHATGLSSTGDSRLDRRLPLPEFFEIQDSTVRAIQAAKARGSRVIAVGTSVMRALEGAAEKPGGLRAGFGETNRKIGPGFQRRIVDGILSGIHAPGESHFELLQSFLERKCFENAEILARSSGLLTHEFGDSSLILSVHPLKT